MAPAAPNEIYQFSLLSAYNGGLRDGGPPVAFLSNHGNHGIGYFEADEDEERPNDMIRLDGVTYSLDKDGDVDRAEKDDQMPFVMVTVFQPTQRLKPPVGTTSKRVKEVFEKGRNTPMPFRIQGKFKYINTEQQTYWDVTGTIFGYCVPRWQGFSGEGLQSCFIDEGKQTGGRVVDFETGDGTILDWAKCAKLHLVLPQDEEFDEVKL